VETGNDSDAETASVASGLESFRPSVKLKKMEVFVKPVNYHLINLDSVCLLLREVYGLGTNIRNH